MFILCERHRGGAVMADKFLVIAADYASGYPYGSSVRTVQYAAEAFG